MGEEDESSKLKSSGVTTRGKHPRGSSGNVGVSREWQAGQDERRSKEWRQVRPCGQTLTFVEKLRKERTVAVPYRDDTLMLFRTQHTK